MSNINNPWRSGNSSLGKLDGNFWEEILVKSKKERERYKSLKSYLARSVSVGGTR